LRQSAKRIDARAEDLALVMSFETAGSFEPSKENPQSHAVGLIQFLPSTLRHLGSSYDEARRMTAVDQLALVEKYFAPYRKPLRSLSRLYMAVLYPRKLDEKETAILFSKGSQEYEQNVNLDINKDGGVSIREATQRVLSMRHGKPSVLLFGDSIAEGLEPYLGRLAGDEASFAAVWKRGTTVRYWLNHIEGLIDKYLPSVVVIALGSNDRPIDPALVEQLIDKSDEWGSQIHWVSPLRDSIVLASAVNGAGATLFETDVHNYPAASDQIHLLPRGYELCANDIWQSIGGRKPSSSSAIASAKQSVQTEEVEGPRHNGKLLVFLAAVPFAFVVGGRK
jgi:lysophospholipase L1-like esterase